LAGAVLASFVAAGGVLAAAAAGATIVCGGGKVKGPRVPQAASTIVVKSRLGVRCRRMVDQPETRNGST